MRVFLLFFSIVLMSCSSSRQSVDATQSGNLDDLIAKKEFRIDATQAFPIVTTSSNAVISALTLPNGSNAGNIRLVGQTAYIKMENDIIEGHLPYYGERRLVTSTFNNSNNGIRFKGTPEKLTITKKTKNRYKINFNIGSDLDTETFQVSMTLFPNNNCSISINSTHRTSISYSGVISEDKEEEVLK
ncbi:DUF4251 domain-containing protein [Flavobacteriaceae bacterium R38]|nr:DUF4251 domain-containing protein [Flavobacteriaceae bacterium R38]